jgi:type II secretory pathway component PulC
VLSGPQGIAIIEHNKRQISLTPGDPLAGEAELVRIFADRIIISRRGHYEALLLD